MGIWQAICAAGIWSPVLLPEPLTVGRYLWAAILDGSLAESAWVTSKRLLIATPLGASSVCPWACSRPAAGG
ncbi:hypothetical protein [Verrucomicrobium spinosum]|uniref:hypothetical protein n=1 Tax=Verrucomicrobium spinosum TaxID=2736 RepID=UPI000AFFE0F9|nr:hypothetical protein [Verrucomicrobium spinosum]